MPHEVVLVRHGETDWSAHLRHTGRTDVPLTADGRRQAERVGRALRGRSFALVLTSPLQRAAETCRLAGFGDLAQPRPELMEWDYGDYEGRTTVDIRREGPDWTVWRYGAPGGESPDHVRARAAGVPQELGPGTGGTPVF